MLSLDLQVIFIGLFCAVVVVPFVYRFYFGLSLKDFFCDLSWSGYKAYCFTRLTLQVTFFSSLLISSLYLTFFAA